MHIEEARGCRTWGEFWFEPWRATHASWLGDAAPSNWAALSRKGRAMCRRGYLVWCEHFDIQAYPAFAENFPRDESVRQLPFLQAASWQRRTAIELGLVVLAGAEEFGVAWVSRRQHLLSIASVDHWREAIERARVRRLPSPWRLSELDRIQPGAESIDLDDVGGIGAAWMRRVTQARWPDAWQRFRLSIPKDWIAAAEARDAEPTSEVVQSAVRQVIRIWGAQGDKGAHNVER